MLYCSAVLNETGLKIPFLTQQIIAYIGNKRALLPLVREALAHCFQGNPLSRKKPLTFVDLFAGSGVVSRLAKYLGYQVFTNDWEYFSYVINAAYISINAGRLAAMYRDQGGLEKLLSRLNETHEVLPEDQYIARCYSPSCDDIEQADFTNERLFYTRANGLAIDRIRNDIEKTFPEKESPEKHLLLAMLLYQAATHTNTSGVFKAFHKGFGGHNRDALRRILAPICLPAPVLQNSPWEHSVYRMDANTFFNRVDAKTDFDLVYLDPPYNQHQYGSNYHLLNTIALWDKPPVNMTEYKRGRLVDKGGIRKDWKKTRSLYCVRDRAEEQFKRLLVGIPAHYILVSYSTEGIIPFGRLKELCAKRGAVQLYTNEYVKYRGGRQSMYRLNNNIEFVLVIETAKKTALCEVSRLDDIIIRRNLLLQFRKGHVKERLKTEFEIDEHARTLSLRLEKGTLTIATRFFFELVPSQQISKLTVDQAQRVLEKLKKAECTSKTEELAELFRILDDESPVLAWCAQKIVHTLKKIAHKKYRNDFYTWIARVNTLERKRPELYSKMQNKLMSLRLVAEKRFNL